MQTIPATAPSALLLALLFLPLASAQVLAPQVGAFGTQVKMGDSDYIPLTKTDSRPVVVAEADFGVPGDVRDDCIVLLFDGGLGDKVAARAAADGTLVSLTNKDLRLTPCQGKPAGTAIADADVAEKARKYTVTASDLRYGDTNANGKYDKGDAVYLVGATVRPAAGLVTALAVHSWTLRLTPAYGHAAGSFVLPGDQDAENFRLIAPKQDFSIVEREDKGWYLVPVKAAGSNAGVASASCGLLPVAAFSAPPTGPKTAGLVKVCDVDNAPDLKNGFIPANSVRVGLAGTLQAQPTINPTRIELPATADYAAGKPLSFSVKVANEGGAAGQGLLVVRLGGEIVDVRLTPILGVLETATLGFKVELPDHGGEAKLQVNEMAVGLDVSGPLITDGSSAAAAQVAALAQKVAELEARLAAQPAAASVVPQASGVAVARSPGLEAVGVFAALAVGLVTLRRRA